MKIDRVEVRVVGPEVKRYTWSHDIPEQYMTNTIVRIHTDEGVEGIGAAANYVDPSYRADFVASHRRWGRSIKLADGEVLSVEFSPEKDSAEAIVTYSWYDLETMTLHDTVVRQHWEADDNFYGLSGETVIEGDPRLFAMADKKTEISHRVGVD